MPRGANPFYYQNDAQLGQALGATLGRALFGDPEAAAKLALRRAQMENYSASADEARAHAGLYGSQRHGVDLQNTASEGLPGLIAGMFSHPDPAPAAPVDPLAPLPSTPAGATAVTFDPQTFRNGLPGLMAAMAQMQGDKVDPNQVVGGLTALMGDDEFARRGMVAQGHTPGKEFALTPERADQIAQQGYTADFNKDTSVARINHASDIPIANIQSADRRYNTDVESGDRRYAADRQYEGKVDAAGLGKTVGFSLVSDVLPGAVMTSGERSREHNAAVDGAPHSYHLPGDGVEAYDIKPGTGARTFADAKAAMQAKYGSRLIEALDETNRPGHGPHWHFAIADGPGGKPAKQPKAISAASAKMLDTEIANQLKARGWNAEGQALQNIRISAQKNLQQSGNPAQAVSEALGYIEKRMAGGGGDDLVAQARAAINKGADPAAVRARYKKLTGKDLGA